MELEQVCILGDKNDNDENANILVTFRVMVTRIKNGNNRIFRPVSFCLFDDILKLYGKTFVAVLGPANVNDEWQRPGGVNSIMI